MRSSSVRFFQSSIGCFSAIARYTSFPWTFWLADASPGGIFDHVAEFYHGISSGGRWRTRNRPLPSIRVLSNPALCISALLCYNFERPFDRADLCAHFPLASSWPQLLRKGRKSLSAG